MCNTDLELVVNTVFSTMIINYDDDDDHKCCTHKQEFKTNTKKQPFSLQFSSEAQMNLEAGPD